MRQVFADTSAWFAMVNADDKNHAAAVQWFKNNPYPLLTTNYIFAETVTLITKRLRHREAVAFGRMLRESRSLSFYRVSESEEKDAWELFQKYFDKDFSFIDCISFAVMKNKKIKEAFTFDKHFEQAGFKQVPEK